MSFSNKIRTFETAIRLNNPDHDKTLLAWQRRAIVTRNALMQIKKDHDKEVAKLRETYTPKALESRLEPLDAEMKEIIALAKKRVSDDLDNVMKEKRKQLDESLKAPTEEAVRLLTVLGMRSDLSQSEIDAASAHVNNNIHAMRLLGDIAKRNGLYYPASVGSVERINSDLDAAETFAREMIDTISIENPGDNLNTFGFWMHPGTRQMEYFSRLIDGNFFTAAQMRDATDLKEAEIKKSEKARQEGIKPNAAKVFLRGDESLAGIAMQFGIAPDEIRKANPGIDVDHLREVTPGTSIIVPAGRFTITNAVGSVVPDQVIAVHYVPEEQERKSYESGSMVDVTEI